MTIHEGETTGDGSAAAFTRQCHELVRDLYKPRPWLYFADFVVSFSLGVICLVVFHRSTDWLIAMGSGAVAGLAIYRCSIFIHEIQHHPEQELRTFARTWNACFGIPCLMPLFLYDEHVAHHSVVSYGTREDSEYLPLRPARLVRSMALMAVSLLYPLLGPLRFAVFTPLALVSRRMNRFVFVVMSSLYNLKPGYRRDWVAAAESSSRWFQEIACCLWAWAWIGAGVLGFIPPSVFWKTYVLFVLWMALNQLRTLTAHRYDGDGSAQGSLSQLLDSNTFDRGWLAEAWAPLGLRYHALHHLLPAVPYHNLGIAHRRLTNALPAGSPYHQTRQAGLWPAILDSFAYGVRVPTLAPACTPATGRPERPESLARARSLPN